MTVMYTSSLIPIFYMTDTQSDDNLLVRHMNVAQHIKQYMAIYFLILVFHNMLRRLNLFLRSLVMILYTVI